MTRELAIKVIKRMIKTGIAYDDGYAFEPLAKDEEKACGMAIKALEQNPKTGHWINDGPVDCYLDKVRCHCSECGKKKNFPADYNQVKQEISISYKYPELIDNYCPNCGCRMEEVNK